MSVVVQTDKTLVVHAPSGTVLVGQVIGGGGVSADWDALANKPLVIAAGNNQQEARDAIALGTAATHNHEEYATAAQGSLADSAIQAGAGLGALDAAANTKLAGIAAGATANDTNAQLRDRATHTGTQPLSTISQSSATNGQVPTWNGTGWVAATPTPAPVQSVAGKVGAITLAKADVGLSNVDNTSDADKPVSIATASAIAAKIGEAPNDGKQYARKNEDWAEVVGGGGGPAVMADITDKQGKVLDDLTLIEDANAIETTFAVGGYIIKEHEDNGVFAGATMLVSANGGVVSQLMSAHLLGKIALRRYEAGVWGEFSFTIAPFDVKNWYNNTTASAADAVINADGTFSREVSTEEFKRDIEPMQDSYADAIVQGAVPIYYRSKCERDPQDWGYWGISAEQLATVDPRLVHWGHSTKEVPQPLGLPPKTVPDLDSPLKPVGVQYSRAVPALLNVVKRQGALLAALDARIQALENGSA